MTEYEKLTVVKLREELVKRGLPKTGLKAALVQRLVEADAQSQRAAASVSSVQQQFGAQTSNGEPDAPVRTVLPTTKAQGQYYGPVDNAANPVSDLEDTEQQIQAATSNKEAATSTPADDGLKHSQATGALEVEPLPGPEAAHQAQNDQETLGMPAAEGIEAGTAETDASTIAAKQNAAEATHEETPVTVEQPEAGEPKKQDVPPFSTQISTIGGEELREDTNKRKRRSQSPPPSSVETAQKRAKADDGRPHVKLPEDETSGNLSEQGVKDANMDDVPIKPPSKQLVEDTQTDGLAQPDTKAERDRVEAEATSQGSMSPEPDKQVEEKPPQEDREPTTPPSATVQSPLKTSPTDTRFKNLFNAPSKREGSQTRPISQADIEDRVVSPALHPATCALYIRDFMRPLNSGNLKDYLTALASPPDTDPDPEIITEFFLDSIRTHCLVNFANTSAASRVRSGLHDRVWPDEKNRRPLWVDFVPEEKLKKWIEVESEAAGDRRQGMKKWEVVYDEEKEGVMAYLQEVGPNSNAPRSGQVTVSRTENGAGVQGAPSGPRGKDTELRTSQSGLAAKPDGGKAFGALDDLFSSTTTKPKLYYLPVARDVVDRRLDRLAAGRGGGRGDEMRRYSFEEGTLVDKGPEFGMRGRGGFGARGGGYRGYSGRGGSYRGDAWRGR